MGWIALLAIVALAMGAMIVARLPRILWMMTGAALALGAVGYALQGSAMLPASPAQPTQVAAESDDPELAVLRDQMLGRFTGDGAYVIAADAMRRSGDKAAAVRVLLGGINRIPDSLLLWTALGTALAANDGERMSPPALLAFCHASRLSPDHPAPPFFAGLVYVRAGDFAAARPLWARALALTPTNAPYRQGIAMRLLLLDRYLTLTGGRAPR
ncbi:tetratricopeptide repeat protein [Sphingomonas jinjuensis]|nr:hypothetical protein [Sphingomonas jinjuensis]